MGAPGELAKGRLKENPHVCQLSKRQKVADLHNHVFRAHTQSLSENLPRPHSANNALFFQAFLFNMSALPGISDKPKS